jgi:hypothetical protein
MSKVTLENFTAFVKDQPKGERINHGGWGCCAVGLFLDSVKSKLDPDKAIRTILGLPTAQRSQAVQYIGNDDNGCLLEPKRGRSKGENLYIQLERGSCFPEVRTFGQLARKLTNLAA